MSPVNGQPLPRGRPPFKPGEEARELGKKGGEKSAQKRAERKTMREDLLELLRVDIKSRDGKEMQTQVALSAALIRQALNGNTKAYEIIRDTIGEKPADNVNIVTADFSALESAFKGLE